jgi:hypothetical protein
MAYMDEIGEDTGGGGAGNCTVRLADNSGDQYGYLLPNCRCRSMQGAGTSPNMTVVSCPD